MTVISRRHFNDLTRQHMITANCSLLRIGVEMNAPAGWYPHPEKSGLLLWWDGTKWTAHTHPAAAPATVAKRRMGLAIAAAILVVVGWIFLGVVLGKVLLATGFVLGIVALIQKQRLKGLSVAAVSVAVLGFFLAIIASTASPEGQASEPVAVEPSAYRELTDRDMAPIIKDPNSYKDERVVFYAKVTQFDSATGDCSFRGNASAVRVESSWDYDENVYLQGGSGGVPCEELKAYVEDDEIKVLATYRGEIKYESSMRASITAPNFRIDKIERIK